MGCSSSKISSGNKKNSILKNENFLKEKISEPIIIKKNNQINQDKQEINININYKNEGLLFLSDKNETKLQNCPQIHNFHAQNNNLIKIESNFINEIQDNYKIKNEKKHSSKNLSQNRNEDKNFETLDEIKFNNNPMFLNQKNIARGETIKDNNIPIMMSLVKTDKSENKEIFKEKLQKEEDFAYTKLSANLLPCKIDNKPKDENELLLNLTKTHISNFQDDINTKNILNSIDNNDNLVIKFNTANGVNSILNNTNFKINESHSQQNTSNIHNPSIFEENKSDRFSFKFDMTSNFDLNSKFSKFDSTNNISRIKVPYFDNVENYILTNSNMNMQEFNSNGNTEKKQILTEEEEIQLPITISVRASKFEAMYPIWIEKKKETSFRVMGKWTIDNSLPMCDCNGYILKNGKKDDFCNMTYSTNYCSASTNTTNLNINLNNRNVNINTISANNINMIRILNSGKSNEERNIEENQVKMNNNPNFININIVSENKNENNALINEDKKLLDEKTQIKTPNINLKQQIYQENQQASTKQSLNCLIQNFPNGCLIGRVLGGEYFQITNKWSFLSDYSGPLFLKMNIHDLRLNPEGKLTILISGAEDMPFMNIEKKLGWDINSLSLGCNLLKSESERLIYTFINKIRLNSSLFAQQYLENIKNLSAATSNLYNNLFINKISFRLLNMDSKLLDFARKLLRREVERIHCENNAKDKKDFEMENKQIIECSKNMENSGYKNVKYFIKKHEDTKPLSVAIKLIIDEKARASIMNSEYNSVGLVTIKSPYAQKSFFTCLIFCFFYINDKEIEMNKINNSIIDINKNESAMLLTE